MDTGMRNLFPGRVFSPFERNWHKESRKMALTANQVRVAQHGDAVVGERTQLIYDEETGMVGQKKTIVAHVPVEGGGHAIVIAEQVQVQQVVKLM